jgi:hypothetical protein
MGRLANAVLIATVVLAPNRAATAGSDAVGVTLTSDRDPGDFGVPKNMKYDLNGAHTFDNGLIVGGSFQFTDTTFSDRSRQNLEGTIGYRSAVGPAFSISGSAGLGEHWREDDPSISFPYYVLRIGADFDLGENITWNAISYRFRDAFDHEDNYDTPQVATGITYKFDGQRAIAVKIMRNWKDDQPSSTGISLGFKQGF